jgi:hypothetical protein
MIRGEPISQAARHPRQMVVARDHDYPNAETVPASVHSGTNRPSSTFWMRLRCMC